MKPILLKKNQIEIPFQDSDGNTVLTLWFDKGDESLKLINKEMKALGDIGKELEGKDIPIEDDLEEANKIAKKAADSLFGEGSYEKLYELNPSIFVVMNYIFQIAIGIKEELESETLKDVENKYLK